MVLRLSGLCWCMLLAPLVPGCVFVPIQDSCDVDTGDIVMNAETVDSGDTVRATVHFETGITPLELCNADVLTINGQEATETSRGTRIEYAVSWSSTDAPDTYEFALVRDGERAAQTTVARPPAFTITMPTGGEQRSRSNDFDITWEPPVDGGEIELRIEDEIAGPCRESSDAPEYARGISVPDVGVVTVRAQSFEYSRVLDDGDGLCDATIELRRTEQGPVPKALAGGEVEARIERRVDFVLGP